jgi:chromosome segregation ATPase
LPVVRAMRKAPACWRRSAIVGKLEHDLSEAMARLVTAKTELKQVMKALDGLRTQVHEGEVAIMGHEKDETRVRHELERHRERLGQLGNEQLELEHRLRAIEIDETSARRSNASPSSSACSST